MLCFECVCFILLSFSIIIIISNNDEKKNSITTNYYLTYLHNIYIYMS